MKWFISEANQEHVVGLYGNICFMIFRRSMQYAGLARLRQMVNTVASGEKRLAVMLLMEEPCEMPGASLRKTLADLFNDQSAKLAGSALVYTGPATKAGMVMAAAAAISLQVHKSPVKSFNQVRSAVDWLTGLMADARRLPPMEVFLMIEQARLLKTEASRTGGAAA